MTDPSMQGGAPVRRQPLEGALPYAKCPKCKGKIIIVPRRASGRSGTMWDVECVNCGANVAQWLPGDTDFTLLYDEHGQRIPNPHNLPGYGAPSPAVAATATADGEDPTSSAPCEPSPNAATSPSAPRAPRAQRGARFQQKKGTRRRVNPEVLSLEVLKGKE